MVYQETLQKFLLQLGWVAYKDKYGSLWYYHPSRKESLVIIKDSRDVPSSSNSSDFEAAFASPSASIGSSSLVWQQCSESANHTTGSGLESREALKQQQFGAPPPLPPPPPSPSPLADDPRKNADATKERQPSTRGVQKLPLQKLSCSKHKEISDKQACVDEWVKELEPVRKFFQ